MRTWTTIATVDAEPGAVLEMVGFDPTNGLRPSAPGYHLAPVQGGSEVGASVGVRPGRGLLGRLLEHATAALFSAGALHTAVSRIAREAVPC